MATLLERAENAEMRARIARARAEERAAAVRTATADAIIRSGPAAFAGSFGALGRDRFRAGPRPVGGSAFGHRDQRSREEMRRDCQEALRVNPVAQTIVDSLADLIVGDGPAVRVVCDDKAWREDAQAALDTWLDACDAGGLATLADLLETCVHACCTDGRVMLLMTDEGFVQTVEDERVVNPNGAADTIGMAAGVRMDSVGRVLHYSVADWDDRGAFVRRGNEREVRPEDALVVRSPLCRAPNVVAPEPALASVLPLLSQLWRAIGTTVRAYEVATLFGAIASSDNPNAEQEAIRDALAAGVGGASGPNPTDPDEVEMRSGQVWFRRNTGSVTQLRPEHPKTGIDQFAWMLVGMVAARLGLPLDETFFTFDRNWSASRSRLSIAWRKLGRWRRMATLVSATLAEYRLRWLIAREAIAKPGTAWGVTVRLAPMPHLDPEREVEVARKRREALFASQQEVMDDLGEGDFNETVRRIASEEQTLGSLGIVRPVPQGAAAPGETADED